MPHPTITRDPLFRSITYNLLGSYQVILRQKYYVLIFLFYSRKDISVFKKYPRVSSECSDTLNVNPRKMYSLKKNLKQRGPIYKNRAPEII